MARLRAHSQVTLRLPIPLQPHRLPIDRKHWITQYNRTTRNAFSTPTTTFLTNLWLESVSQWCPKFDAFIRVRLHLVIATPLWWRCDIALKLNVWVRYCTVTYSVCDCDCDCDIAEGLLCEQFKSDVAAILEWQSQSLYVNGQPVVVWNNHNFGVSECEYFSTRIRNREMWTDPKPSNLCTHWITYYVPWHELTHPCFYTGPADITRPLLVDTRSFKPLLLVKYITLQCESSAWRLQRVHPSLGTSLSNALVSLFRKFERLCGLLSHF